MHPQACEPASPADRPSPWRAWIGLAAGAAAATAIELLVPLGPNLSIEGRSVLAVAALMAIWWTTEALPLAVTALVPLVLLPLIGAGTMAQVATPYADPIILLFLGGLILGIALEASGLHRRIALRTLWIVGTGPRRVIGGVMIATTLIGMWISNTAAAAMMTPIGLGIVSLAERRRAGAGDPASSSSPVDLQRFAAAMMLAIAYAASIKGMSTKIGTPPNLYMIKQAQGVLGREISFLEWMIVGVPITAVLLVAVWVLLCFVIFRLPRAGASDGRSFIRAELAALGRLSNAEWITLIVFVGAAGSWILREHVARLIGLSEIDHVSGAERILLTDAGIAIAAAVLLFILPISLHPRRHVMTWQQAERLPWGVLLLFGGGLSLAEAMGRTGVNSYLGAVFHTLGDQPTIVVLLIVCFALGFMGELASNTAIAAGFIPVLAAAAPAMGLDPMILLFAATFSISCGFMLPVATPPNAIVFATGKVPLRTMLRAGLIADVLCIGLVVIIMSTIGPWLLRIAGIAAD